MKNISTKKLALVGVFTALCFAANYISIPVPATVGITRVHVANGICILAGMILGPLFGGFCAGFGAMLYDFTNPIFAPGAPITFLMKFVLGLVAGLIAYSGGRKAENNLMNLIAAIAAAFSYVIVYLIKTFITAKYVKGLPMEAVWVDVGTKAWASSINAIIAIILSVVLIKAILPLVKRNEVDDI